MLRLPRNRMILSLELDGQNFPVLMILDRETYWCSFIVGTPTSKFESSIQVIVRKSSLVLWWIVLLMGKKGAFLMIIIHNHQQPKGWWHIAVVVLATWGKLQRWAQPTLLHKNQVNSFLSYYLRFLALPNCLFVLNFSWLTRSWRWRHGGTLEFNWFPEVLVSVSNGLQHEQWAKG